MAGQRFWEHVYPLKEAQATNEGYTPSVSLTPGGSHIFPFKAGERTLHHNLLFPPRNR